MARTCGNCGKSCEDHAMEYDQCKCILTLRTKTMSKIIIEYDEETGNLIMDAKMELIQLLGVLEMAKMMVLQHKTKR